ncbi:MULTISPECIES: alpha/beta hydrolase family protein [unclassified Arsukibacterium]|uniref:alpha/beta hydrolase family protein n=1 Tax=unclassified Arsukibacterium TaxID=2635278 RepID=UPI000C3A7CDC|nr:MULTISPECIES: alpha/beta fold hydrolase [unclassified Arsukibacterium]MAA94406.1 esterase [Rheinheimera sp.]MBM33320.1 esterase [Rheinheimera sp.]HAW94127.1 alpha/beta hydrolase [Candidatus Azambacteria bacterium]|tara:strand:- start:58166 stop:59080 length:915 start_codon:yes stop_codon:yes gene_type:complete
MIKILITILIGAVLLLSGCAQKLPDDEQSNSASAELPSLHIINNVSYSSLAALSYTDSSIRLTYGTEPLQYGQLYLPQTATMPVKAPLVVFIHGGCWLNAYDISHSRAFSQALAAEGFAVWSLEYRRTGDSGGGWPGSFTDVLAGISSVPSLLSGYPIDSNNIVLAGHSAGGQLALLAAGKSYHQPVLSGLPAIKGVVGLAAITDMPGYSVGNNSCQQATHQFLQGSAEQQPEYYLQANPQQQAMHPKTMLLHGTTDSIVPLAQASGSGMPFQLVADAGHFDWIHPQTLAYKKFIATLQELFAQ